MNELENQVESLCLDPVLRGMTQASYSQICIAFLNGPEPMALRSLHGLALPATPGLSLELCAMLAVPRDSGHCREIAATEPQVTTVGDKNSPSGRRGSIFTVVLWKATRKGESLTTFVCLLMHMPQHTSGGQRATCRSYPLWVPGIEVRESSLVTSSFTC